MPPSPKAAAHPADEWVWAAAPHTFPPRAEPTAEAEENFNLIRNSEFGISEPAVGIINNLVHFLPHGKLLLYLYLLPTGRRVVVPYKQ